jgi:hypothetical protein
MRSQFLRQAIERNLRHYQRVERAIFARIYQNGHELGRATQRWAVHGSMSAYRLSSDLRLECNLVRCVPEADIAVG